MIEYEKYKERKHRPKEIPVGGLFKAANGEIYMRVSNLPDEDPNKARCVQLKSGTTYIFSSMSYVEYLPKAKVTINE